MSYLVIPYHIPSHLIIACGINTIISCHALSYHIISHRILSYHTTVEYHTISYEIKLYHIKSYHMISYTTTRLPFGMWLTWNCGGCRNLNRGNTIIRCSYVLVCDGRILVRRSVVAFKIGGENVVMIGREHAVTIASPGEYSTRKHKSIVSVTKARA